MLLKKNIEESEEILKNTEEVKKKQKKNMKY